MKDDPAVSLIMAIVCFAIMVVVFQVFVLPVAIIIGGACGIMAIAHCYNFFT